MMSITTTIGRCGTRLNDIGTSLKTVPLLESGSLIDSGNFTGYISPRRGDKDTEDFPRHVQLHLDKKIVSVAVRNASQNHFERITFRFVYSADVSSHVD